MYIVEHEFYPGEMVFVVLDKHTVRQARVVQVDIKIYEKDVEFIESLVYLVAIKKTDNGMTIETTARVEPDKIFETIDEALEAIRSVFLVSST